MLRPISWCACFSTFLAYFSFPFSFLVVAAASAEDSICVPLPGSLPPPGTLPCGTYKKRCCQDERPSGVRIRQLLAWCLVCLKGTRNCTLRRIAWLPEFGLLRRVAWWPRSWHCRNLHGGRGRTSTGEYHREFARWATAPERYFSSPTGTTPRTGFEGPQGGLFPEAPLGEGRVQAWSRSPGRPLP